MKVFNIDSINGLERPTAVTVGMFDGVHLGHRHLLRTLHDSATRLGLAPVVVTFANHPRMVLCPDEPFGLLSTFDERLAMLEACGVEHVAVVSFDRQTASLSACRFAEEFLCNRLDMRLLVLGYDNQFGSRAADDFSLLPHLARSHGFDIGHDKAVVVNGVEVSSTKIRHALLEGNIAAANAMLGAPYRLSGTVVHGRHVGTRLGFPTANVAVADSHKLLPASGVYALTASVDGTSYAAMANLGAQPTFGLADAVLEVNLLNFNGDIYGKPIEVQFIDRLRDIVSFSSADELRQQLEKDRASIMALFY